MGNSKGRNHREGRVSIATISQLRKQLTSIWNDYREGKISSERARTFGYLAGILRQCLVDGDLELRMKQLEAHLIGEEYVDDEHQKEN